MDVILAVGPDSRNIGSRAMLNALFDTIACRLEPDGRATRFPVVSGDLKYGRLAPSHAAAALQELGEIRPALQVLPGASILWTGRPGASNGANNALDWLAAPDGKPLIDHLRSGVEQCLTSRQVMMLRSPQDEKFGRWVMACVGLGGAAWASFGYVWIPRWLISPLGSSDERPSGIPIWSIGILVMALAVCWLALSVMPGVKVWFTRRQWAIQIGVLAVTALWMIRFVVW